MVARISLNSYWKQSSVLELKPSYSFSLSWFTEMEKICHKEACVLGPDSSLH